MNIGVIGCGRIADAHIMIYQFMENTKVMAVADVNLEKAKEIAAKYKVKKVFRDYAFSPLIYPAIIMTLAIGVNGMAFMNLNKIK